MKTEHLALAITAAASFFAWRIMTNKPKNCQDLSAAGMGKEILNGDGKPHANGWRYFEGGWAMSPDCQLHKGGQQINGGPTIKNVSSFGGMFTGQDQPALLGA